MGLRPRARGAPLLVKPYFNLNSYGKRAVYIKSANSIDDFKHFFLCELMNRDVFTCYLIFYLLCTFIYFVVSV